MWFLIGFALAQSPPGHFSDAEHWAGVFDDPTRENWQKPDKLVAALAIDPGSTVADIGAGTGYFEPFLAAAVGEDGHVVAIDVEPNLVQHMAKRFADARLTNVEARLGTPTDPKLQKREAHLILVVNTYHHIDDRVAYFTRLLDTVKGAGRLVIVDFRESVPPPPGPPRDERLSADQVQTELTQAGWRFDHADDLLSHQYVLFFRK